MTSATKRAAATAVLAFSLVAVLAAGRTVWHAADELQTARTFRDAGNSRRAIEHYRRTLRWYFPLTPYESRATDALSTIARRAEDAGDVATALLAWRSLVGGLNARRFSYSASDPILERGKDEVARLLSLHGRVPIDAGMSVEQLREGHRRMLDRVPSPNAFWATLLLLGFAAWIASLVALTRRGFDTAGRIAWPASRSALWGAALGFVSFVLGLVFA